MRNDELFNPSCPDDHAKRLVAGYAMRGLLDSRGAYSQERLLAMQHEVYLDWLTATNERRPGFECGFYEWLCRRCDAAFVFRPGDLVKYAGCYCLVVRRCPEGVSWVNYWRLRGETPAQDAWPLSLCTVELKSPDGRTSVVDALDASIEPADIPPEIFALACGRARDCPMVKGGRE